ncbi:putative glucomannan 4-beta-mannosyltransferase [Helianthus annuus]|nr:putative glucomannan 4-beta-mannosyltransferase [Helianthus annuus]
MVEIECQKWASKGINIHYQVRDNRKGYKAGALKEGLKHPYANECEYVAIFDADFQPEPEFCFFLDCFLESNFLQVLNSSEDLISHQASILILF